MATTYYVDVATGNDANAGTSPGAAFASMGKAQSVRTGADKVYVKGTLADNVTQAVYTITTATTNVPAGCISSSAKDGSNTNMNRTEGYGVTPGDMGTPPIFRLASGLSGATIWNFSTHTGERVVNIVLDGNGNATTTGFGNYGPGCITERCKVTGCTTGYTLTNSSGTALLCEATGNTTGFSVGGSGNNSAQWCWSHGNTGDGFLVSSGGANATAHCLANNNGGSGFVLAGSSGRQSLSCTGYNNTSHGFSFSNDAVGTDVTNCVAWGNGGTAFSTTGTVSGMSMFNCAGPSSGYNAAQVGFVSGYVTLTGDPFDSTALAAATTIDAAFAAVRPNATAGAGASLRGAGLIPYIDIGAAQHQDSGGGTPVTRAY